VSLLDLAAHHVEVWSGVRASDVCSPQFKKCPFLRCFQVLSLEVGRLVAMSNCLIPGSRTVFWSQCDPGSRTRFCRNESRAAAWKSDGFLVAMAGLICVPPRRMSSAVFCFAFGQDDHLGKLRGWRYNRRMVRRSALSVRSAKARLFLMPAAIWAMLAVPRCAAGTSRPRWTCRRDPSPPFGPLPVSPAAFYGRHYFGTFRIPSGAPGSHRQWR